MLTAVACDLRWPDVVAGTLAIHLCYEMFCTVLCSKDENNPVGINVTGCKNSSASKILAGQVMNSVA